MSGIMKSSLFFTKKVGSYSDGWGEVTGEDRTWEQSYRDRWAHDKIVRSTHGVNCTGSCSWQVYVKDGIVVWETQETDYPPPHPRRCAESRVPRLPQRRQLFLVPLLCIPSKTSSHSC